jgi:hypothetical protein
MAEVKQAGVGESVIGQGIHGSARPAAALSSRLLQMKFMQKARHKMKQTAVQGHDEGQEHGQHEHAAVRPSDG